MMSFFTANLSTDLHTHASIKHSKFMLCLFLVNSFEGASFTLIYLSPCQTLKTNLVAIGVTFPFLLLCQTYDVGHQYHNVCTYLEFHLYKSNILFR